LNDAGGDARDPRRAGTETRPYKDGAGLRPARIETDRAVSPESFLPFAGERAAVLTKNEVGSCRGGSLCPPVFS